jgi:hypothetical protein
METKRVIKGCRIIKENVKVDIKVERGILNSVKISFNNPITRKSREDLEKCLRKEKFNVVWGDKQGSLLIK